MLAKQIFEKLKAEFGDSILELVEEEFSDTYIKVSPARILEIMLFLRDESGMEFDYLADLCGMDYKPELGVVYNLYSVKHKHRISLKANVTREEPKLSSVERVWKTANWHEREAFDLFGIVFEGHPNLIRILNPYDWEGYPLRKDYKTPEEYHGMRVPY